MSSSDMTVLTHVSLITCIVQRGMADRVVEAAQEAGAQGATIHYGRGSGIRERLGLLGLAIEVEKEIITSLVADEQVDRVFEKMFFAGRLNVPGMGIIYVTRLEKAATFIPQDVLKRLGKDRRNQQS